MVSARVDEQDRDAAAAAMRAFAQAHLLIATHHPLLWVNCPWLDRDMIKNAEELITWLAECSVGGGEPETVRLRGVAFGHAHQIVEGTCAGLPVWGAPSTCFQFLPESPTFAVDDLCPGYRWLHLHDNGDITTRVGRAGDFRIDVELGQHP